MSYPYPSGSDESSRYYQSSSQYRHLAGYQRAGGYPPTNLPPVKPYPADPYIDQFSLSEALHTGTLFRWLYDPYQNPYET